MYQITWKNRIHVEEIALIPLIIETAPGGDFVSMINLKLSAMEKHFSIFSIEEPAAGVTNSLVPFWCAQSPLLFFAISRRFSLEYARMDSTVMVKTITLQKIKFNLFVMNQPLKVCFRTYPKTLRLFRLAKESPSFKSFVVRTSKLCS